MGFKIAYGNPPPRTIWVPVDRTSAQTLYVGQLVKCDSTSVNGVAPLADANGAADTSGAQVIFGVIVGTSDFPGYTNFLATYGQYISSVQTVAAQLARRNLGLSGMYAKGDPQALVQIAVLGPETVLEGQFCNATQGVAPTLLTATAVNATMGLGMTTNACDVATVQNMCTTYCRTGANAGLYRVNKSAHATVHTYDTYWPYTLAIGDTFVIVPARQGESFININTTSTYLGTCIDTAQTPATNYFQATVLSLDLREAGKEKCLFKFSPIHFTAAR